MHTNFQNIPAESTKKRKFSLPGSKFRHKKSTTKQNPVYKKLKHMAYMVLALWAPSGTQKENMRKVWEDAMGDLLLSCRKIAGRESLYFLLQTDNSSRLYTQD